MATRRDIRTNFYAALETASDGLVPRDNIGEDSPDDDADYPSITHNDDYRKVPLNMGSAAPVDVNRDAAGDVVQEVYETTIEASFGLVIEGQNEQTREDVYEAVRSYFERYEEGGWSASDIHPDVEWVRVLDSNSVDDPDATPTVRGDRLLVRITFTRDLVKDVDPTSTIGRNLTVD